MREIDVDTIHGKRREKVFTVEELNLEYYTVDVEYSRKKEVRYRELSCAFDIETTNIPAGYCGNERPFAYMYHAQFCISKQVVFMRTWAEVRRLFERLTDFFHLSSDNRIVIWVHNMAFEFQFMRRFFPPDEIFLTDDRKPLRYLYNGIEFRCSYRLSNMSLAKFCENTANVEHYKLEDTFDYDKIRTTETELTNDELAYCYNDVRGLCECIDTYRADDTLAKMPMTSTGFVRRDYRAAMQANPRNRRAFLNAKISAPIYMALRSAFRGGDTHANILWAFEPLANVGHADIVSSYPAAMLCDRYPVGQFHKMNARTFLRHEMNDDLAYLIHIRLMNVRYVGKCGNPYIPIAKCAKLMRGYVNDNGRVRYAPALEMWVTDIDLYIIENEYTWDDILISDVYATSYGHLPDEFKDTLRGYYSKKTALKGVSGAEYEYIKMKNRVNSGYGMTVQTIDRDRWEYIDGECKQTNEPGLAYIKEMLEEYYKNRSSFLPYQWGVWVTANARKRLRDMLNIVGADVVYCDTDSIFFVGDHYAEFEEKNAELKELADEYGASAIDAKGNKHYAGTWELDAPRDHFATLGAKKYLEEIDGKFYATISGVAKKAGRDFFNKYGFEKFRNGVTIENSGHLVAYYNDDDIHTINIDGVEMETAANVAMQNGEYTIGVTGEYLDLYKKSVDNISDLIYD